MSAPPPDEPVTRRVELKGFRIDLLIAVCALLVSSLATAASLWQSRVVSQQLSSQVWPYLALQSTIDKSAVTLAISNEGLGPARVRSVVLSLDGVPHRYLTETLRLLMPGKKANPHGTFSDVQPGSVVRVGGSVTLFRIIDPPIVQALVHNYPRLGMRVCYCAIIPGNCWLIRRDGGKRGNQDPEPVAECPDPGDTMLESGMGPDAPAPR
jgi:hypothetical protein